MNIFNFIYCFFYNKYDRSVPGRLIGSSFVLIAIGLYLITIFELTYVITDYKITFFSRPEGMSLFRWKQKGFMYFIPCAIFVSFFSNNKRSGFLIEKFNNRDEYLQQGDTNRVITYLLIPFILTTLLICLKQYNII